MAGSKKKYRAAMSLAGALVLLAMDLGYPLAMRAQVAAPSGAAKVDQTSPQTPLAPHDLSGLWFGGQGGGLTIKGKVPPLQPEAKTRYDANVAERNSDRILTSDPTFRCEPAGVPHIYGVGGYPMEILQTPDRIFFFYESVHTFRTIWMDGRKAPEDADPLWFGYSVGHWDGNDLVVDTTGFNDRTWLSTAGYPHSEALHVTERFHRPDRGHLQLEITIDDPKSYTQPWKMGVNFTLQSWEMGESFCVPENQANFRSQVIDPNNKEVAAPKK
jgi:hypothetical protein